MVKTVKRGEKITKPYELRQLKHGSVVIPAKMVKALEKIEKKEKRKI